MGDPRAVWLFHLRARAVAARVIGGLARAGIDVLPVKGIVTGATLYRDVAERPLTDVDLRFRPADFGEIVAWAGREGIRIVQRMRTYSNVVLEVDGLHVDLEAHVAPPFTCALSIDTMLARSTPSDLFGVPHVLPDPYDHDVLLLHNVFKDKLGHAFRWAIADVQRTPTRAGFHAPTLLDRLERARSLTMATVVADWMVGNDESDAWVELRDSLRARCPRPGYARRQAELLRRLPHDALALRLHNRWVADDPWLRARAIARAIAWTVEGHITGGHERREPLPADVRPLRPRSP